MRTRSTILSILFFSSCTMVFGQTKTRGYQFVFGKDTFQTVTTISKDPFEKGALREYSVLFKNQSQIIVIPKRIDIISVRNISNSSRSRIRIDTVDQIHINKIVDTISKDELTNISNSEILIYDRTVKLKFDEAHFETIQPSGKTSFIIDLKCPKVNEEKHAYESLASLKEGGHLILRTVWFYDSNGNRQEIECNIAWMIE